MMGELSNKKNLMFMQAIATGNLGIEIYVSQPTPFIIQYLTQLLPDWTDQTVWMLLILQQSQVSLMASTPQVQPEKDRLRQQFLQWSQVIVQESHRQGFLTDFFDPMTGYPVVSSSGEITHDDVKTVQTLLGYDVIQNQCTALTHPLWQTAVYPGVLITSVPPEIFKSEIIAQLFDLESKSRTSTA